MDATKFFIGLDVHSKSTTYAVRSADGTIVASGSCATRYEDIRKGVEPYLFNCRIGLESCTSYYHVYLDFKKHGYVILVANTLRIRQLVVKNDQLDAERLSDMLRLGSFPTSYVPDEKLMTLRSMVKIRQNFVEESTRLQNQITASLSKYGCMLPILTPFTKKWCRALQLVIAMKPQLKEVEYTFDHYRSTEERIEKITDELIAFAKAYWDKEYTLLDSIPGIGEVLACYFIAEICPITRFSNERKLRRYAGVVPCVKESGGKIYGCSLPKSSSRSLLTWALVQATHSAVKGKNNLARYYKKKKKTKPTSKAIMATSSSLSDVIFNVLSKQKPYVIQ